MCLKSLRYSHAKYCTAKCNQPAPPARIKKEIHKHQNDYENLRQTNSETVVTQVDTQPIQQVRMNTLRERKQEKYNDMMENAF